MAQRQWWQRVLSSLTLERSVKITTICTHLVVIIGGGAAAWAFVWQTAEKASLRDDAKFNGKWTDEGCVNCSEPALGHYVTIELTSDKGQISGVIDASDPSEKPIYDETKAKTPQEKAIALASNNIWSSRHKFISLTGTRWLDTGTVQIIDVVNGKMVNYGRARISAKDGVLNWHLIEGAPMLPRDITLYRLDDLPDGAEMQTSSTASNK
ncbi:hypothetical protein Q1W73_00595 [Asticcacaulis sp. ZE23SCel15]|uniref:hypothetical protein n=1 Tax=Asticcacaulis sp. ZE23SCel15 TaxID=3059027 RepID=UPI00265EBF57|nr:hypothetical protein [Asticcacaulis sp. ZE23SCel15]WKL57518.1 hypothetical protein Q1W73_00595 [Asticcacaulis sp. ZE23SCel15]